MSTTGKSFEYAGSPFTASWLDAEQTRLSVRTADVVIDEDGVDQTDWPSDQIISEIVGKEVWFQDVGDHPDQSEAIYYAAIAKATGGES